jgi:hypothetical protein
MISGQSRNLWRLVRAYIVTSVTMMGISAGCGRTGLEAEATVGADGPESRGNMASGNSADASSLDGRGASNVGGGGQDGSPPAVGGSDGSPVHPPESGEPDGRGAAIDRCQVPGPPPATGASDGSDYHFGTPATYAIGANGLAIFEYLSLGDVNGDNHPDLLLSDYFEPALLQLQAAPGRLGAPTKLDVGATGFAAGTETIFANIGVSGKPDIVVGLHGGLSLLLNDGSGRFLQSQYLPGLSMWSLIAFDIDGDQDRDVLALEIDDSTSTPPSIVVYLNDGSGVLARSRALALDAPSNRIRVADVTGDGRPEVLASAENPSRVRIFEPGGFEKLTLVNELVGGGRAHFSDFWFEVGDLDGDGAYDVVMVEDENAPDMERVWVSLQRGGSLEAPRPIYILPKDGGNIAGGELRIFDLNLDGRNDIAITSTAFDMIALLGIGSGDFRAVRTEYPTFGSILASAIAVGDVNCDGCPDVLGSQVGAVVLFPGVGCARGLSP